MWSFLNDILNLFYPKLCPCCGNILNSTETILCFPCGASLPFTNFHLEENNPLEKVFRGRIPLKKGASYLYFRKGGKVQDLMHYFKYKGAKETGMMLGEGYGLTLKQAGAFMDMDYIIPVPLHPKKEKKRGFNQSAEFGAGLSKGLGAALYTDAITRLKDTDSQTRKTRIKRWENVENIFQVNSPEKLAGKKILLIDDIVTTGATLESCAAALLALNEGIEINIATIAFAT